MTYDKLIEIVRQHGCEVSTDNGAYTLDISIDDNPQLELDHLADESQHLSYDERIDASQNGLITCRALVMDQWHQLSPTNPVEYHYSVHIPAKYMAKTEVSFAEIIDYHSHSATLVVPGSAWVDNCTRVFAAESVQCDNVDGVSITSLQNILRESVDALSGGLKTVVEISNPEEWFAYCTELYVVPTHKEWVSTAHYRGYEGETIAVDDPKKDMISYCRCRVTVNKA